jgi:hypothetical protein
MSPGESDVTLAEQLRRMVNGYQLSQAIHVAATLGIADLLRDGPRSSDELAAETDSHAPTLYRLLRALASQGVFHEDEARRFELTELGQLLRTDHPQSVAAWVSFVGRPHHWQAWAHLEHSVRTGENAFSALNGVSVWEWRAARPDESARFDAAMTENSRRQAEAIVDAYRWSQFGCVVDVGGGQGALLGAILARNPAVRGILLDQAHVVAGAPAVLEAAGVADRCEIVGRSFLESVPDGGDAYVLKSILHDWDDDAILRTCRRAMRADARLLLIERVVGAPNEDAATKMSDLLMLVSPGGRERTRDEWSRFLLGAGFRLTEVTPTPAGIAIIEATPV